MRCKVLHVAACPSFRSPLLAELSRSRPADWSAATGTGGQLNRDQHTCFALLAAT